MSKYLLILFSLTFSATTRAATQMNCDDIEIYEQDQNGNGTFIKVELSISIEDDSAAPHGFRAKISAQGQTKEVKDVKILQTPGAQSQVILDLAKYLLPKLDPADIQNVRIGNVGVKANEQDANGIYIFDLLGADGRLLGKLLAVGWSYGRCNR
jgi:hypothetical protein